MSALADDDVVVHGNPERSRDIEDRLGMAESLATRGLAVTSRECAGARPVNGMTRTRWVVPRPVEPMLGYWVRSRRTAMRMSVGVAP